MKLKQISLFVENKPGTVNAALKLLADNGVNISTLSLSDSKFFGVLRLLIRDWEKARDLLEAHNFAVKITDVIGFVCPNTSGSLAIVLRHLSDNGVFIEYMYSFANGDVATVVIRPTDLDACENILAAKKVELMAANDLYQL